MEKRSAHNIFHHSVIWYFIFFVVLIGGAPIAIKIIFSELSPFYLGFIRYSFGSAFFWVVVFLKRLEVPRGRALIGAVLYGILGFGFAFLFLALGLVKTSASLGSVLMALLPLLTIILSTLQRTESLTGRGVFGAFLAVAGTSLSVGGTPAVEISLPHILSIILGTAFMGESNVVYKKFPRSHPIVTNAIAMGSAALVLAIASLINGEAWVIPTQPATWIALVYQVIPVTIVAFFLYTQVLDQWTASATSYAFVLIPIVTVFIASVFYGEHITSGFLIGASLILAGVLVGVLLPGKKREMINRELEDCRPC